MRTLIFILCLFLNMGLLYANIQEDIVLNQQFQSQVKSVDEFIQRFNGKETNPLIVDSLNTRENNLLALFDNQIIKEESDSVEKRNIKAFINNVASQNLEISLTDSPLFAETNVTAVVNGKKVSLGIVLQSQTYLDNRVRWAIIAVKGLSQSGILNLSQVRGISPVEHEIHFLGLSDIFMNPADIMGFRGKQIQIDELSVFLTLAMLGRVKDVEVQSLVIHCVQIPGFAFSIKEYNRQGYNNGWLISNIELIADNNMYNYIKNVLHYEN